MEKAPEVYKPRKGQVNNNKAKFLPIQIDYMMEYARELIVQFGYDHLFETTKGPDDKMINTLIDPITNSNDTGDKSWIRGFN